MSCQKCSDEIAATLAEGSGVPGSGSGCIARPQGDSLPDMGTGVRRRLLASGHVCTACGFWHQGRQCLECHGGGSLGDTVRRIRDAGDVRQTVLIMMHPGALSDPDIQQIVRNRPSPAFLVGAVPKALMENGMEDVLTDLVQRYPPLAQRSVGAQAALENVS